MPYVERSSFGVHFYVVEKESLSALAGVAPLPNDFMKGFNFVALKDGGNSHAMLQQESRSGNDRYPLAHMKKQEKRKLRRERWLESEAVCRMLSVSVTNAFCYC